VLLIPKRHRPTDGRLTVASPRSALASRGKNIGMLTGVLFPELLTCLIIIEKKTPELLQQLNITPTLHSLLDALDAFNRCAPGLLRDDADDLSFPSLQGYLR